jgi:hypothetical protein
VNAASQGETMRILIICAAAAALALSGCGRRDADKEATPASVAAPAPASPAEAALRAQAGKHYQDFAAAPGMGLYGVENLGLDTAEAARFSQNMEVTTPGSIVTSNGVTALVFTGCRQHNCGATASVLAIDVATGDAFVGVKDDAGEAVLKSNARLQMLLTSTSPSRAWSRPVRG